MNNHDITSSCRSQTSPRVSIGLPVYNGGDYLESAIAAVLGQTFTDFELILADNGSTDQTDEICRRAAASDPRIIHDRSPINRGAAWNFNRTFTMARGEFFKWMAHDDLLEPGFLEPCVTALEGNPGAVLAYPRTLLIDEAGRPLRPVEDRLALADQTPHDRLAAMLARVDLCNPLMGLIRREALARTRLIDRFRGCDYVLLAELAMLGEFIEISERLFLRRIHPHSSRRANTDNRSILHWFDTAATHIPRFPRLRLVVEFVRSAVRLQANPLERALCAWAVRHWVLARLRAQGGRYKARVLAVGNRVMNMPHL